MSESRDRPKTVGELIADLQKFPPDLRVMVTGYEGGYHDAGTPELIKVKLNHYDEWYYGPHDYVTHAEAQEGVQHIEAVVVG